MFWRSNQKNEKKKKLELMILLNLFCCMVRGRILKFHNKFIFNPIFMILVFLFSFLNEEYIEIYEI